MLQPYYEKEAPGFLDQRTQTRDILTRESELSEIVQLVGRSALDEKDKLTLDVATLLKNDFVRSDLQSGRR